MFSYLQSKPFQLLIECFYFMYPCHDNYCRQYPRTKLKPRDSNEDTAYEIAAFVDNEGLGIMFLSVAPIKPKAGLTHKLIRWWVRRRICSLPSRRRTWFYQQLHSQSLRGQSITAAGIGHDLPKLWHGIVLIIRRAFYSLCGPQV